MPAEPAPIAGKGYQIVFEDDFGTFNTDVWVPQPWFAGSVLPDMATVANGVLTVRASVSNNFAFAELTSLGQPITPYPYRPNAKRWQKGYIEARFRYINNPWTYVAFWMLSYELANRWPESQCPTLRAEWDIVENGIGGFHPDDRAWTVLHRNNLANDCGQPALNQNFSNDGDGFSDWHVWAGKWTDTQVCTYLDDVQRGCLNVYDSTAQPMYLVLQAGKGDAGGANPVPNVFETQVDWVRVWQQSSNIRRSSDGGEDLMMRRLSTWTVIRPQPESDGAGGQRIVMAEIRTERGDMRQLVGQELIEAQAAGAEHTHAGYFRFRADIGRNDVLRRGDDRLLVLTVASGFPEPGRLNIRARSIEAGG